MHTTPSRRSPRRLLPSRPALLLFLLPGLVGQVAEAAAQSDTTVIYLFRHAERAEDGTNDPPLSDEGEARASLMAAILRDARIGHIHTTDFKRTRATGAPTAGATGLEMELYDPRDLGAFADRLRATRGRHLVLGHSNTTPQLVEALGGDPGDPISEMEYDRAYVVVILPSGATGSAIFRFGSG